MNKSVGKYKVLEITLELANPSLPGIRDYNLSKVNP